MKSIKLIAILSLIVLVALVSVPKPAFGQEIIEHGPNFIDENGDGYNDNAPDADGDGIPNGQDEDWEFTGRNHGRRGFGPHGFVDEDGDGFNDNAPGLKNHEYRLKWNRGFNQSPNHRKGRGKGFLNNNVNNRYGRDFDGDGIPNGMDEDFHKQGPADRRRMRGRFGHGNGQKG